MKDIKSKKRRKQEIKIKKSKIFLLVLIIILVLGIYYIIEETDFLLPKIDEATASYISFNNSNSTDMLKITNIKRMEDSIGKSILNTHKVKFDISGKKNLDFTIELYSLGNKIENKYIKYAISKKNKIIEIGTLENKEESQNGEIILYQDKLKEDNTYEIKIWIDKEYKKKINNVSYEIKIK